MRALRGRGAAFLLPALLVLASAFLSPAALAQTRIAILGDAEANRVEIDCLTAAFSKEPGVDLVERSAIDKIVAEHKLSAMGLSAADAVKAGAMLGAKGVIIVKPFDWEGKSVLSARLVATESGAILGAWIQDTASKEANHFANAVKFELAPRFKLLSVDRKTLAALSILDIRAAVDSPESKELERKITLLLSQRLMLEKDIAVLERWRLGNVAWEKELNLDENPFWTGSSVLDGSVESSLDGKGTVNVSLRLRKPGKAAPESIAVSGSTLDLKALVEKMVPLLKAKLGKAASSEAVAWDMAKEAEFYFEEAKWLLRAGSYERAREAADAASALGKTGPEIVFVLVNSYCGELDGKAISAKLTATAKASAKKPSKLLAEEEGSLLQGSSDRLLQALDVYIKFVEAGPQSLPGRFTEETDWRMLGTSLLNASWQLLDKIHSNKIHLQSKAWGEKAKLMRSMARKAASLTMEKGDGSWTMAKFYTCYTNVGVLAIFDDPAGIAAEFKRLLARPFPLQAQMPFSLRSNLCRSFQFESSLRAPSWAPPPAAPKGSRRELPPTLAEVLHGAVEELSSSSSPQDRIDALLLSGDVALGERVGAALWEERDNILEGKGKSFQGHCAEALLFSPSCSKSSMLKVLFYGMESQSQVWDADSLSTLFFRISNQNTRSSRDNSVESTAHEPSQSDYDKLAEAWYSYYARVRMLPDGYVLDLAKNNIESCLAKLSSCRPPQAQPFEAAKAEGLSSPFKPLAIFPLKGLFPEHTDFTSYERAFFSDGQFQLAGFLRKEKSARNEAFLISLGEKGDAEKPFFVASPSASKSMPPGLYEKACILKEGGSVFYASPYGDIFAMAPSGAWKLLVSDAGFLQASSIAAAKGKLYVGYGQSEPSDVADKAVPSGIVQVDVSNGALKVLASSKRNPPLSPLDNCPVWYPDTLLLGFDGSLVAHVASRISPFWDAVFLCDPESGAWKTQAREISEYKEMISRGCNTNFRFRKQLCRLFFDPQDSSFKKLDVQFFAIDHIVANTPNPGYRDSRHCIRLADNGAKIFSLRQADVKSFEIRSLNIFDEKKDARAFNLPESLLPAELKFLLGFSVSEEFFYILMGNAAFGNVESSCLLKFPLASLAQASQLTASPSKANSVYKTFEAQANVPPGLKPGLRCKSFKGAWRDLPDLSSAPPAATQIVAGMTPPKVDWSEGAAFSLEGYLKIEKEGLYSFYTKVRSGGMLVLGKNWRLERRNIPDNGILLFKGVLKPGWHSLRLCLFTDEPGRQPQVFVQGPDFEKPGLTDSIVFYDPAAN